MRILIVHNFYQQPGGEDAVFRDEVELLRTRGHHVATFTLSNDSIGRGSVKLAAETIWNHGCAKRLADTVTRERTDVVHFHNTFPLISPAAYPAVREAGAAAIQTLHNYRLLCPNAQFLRGGKTCELCLGKSVAWNALIHRCYRGSFAASSTLVAMLSVHRLKRTWATAVDRYIALSEFSREKFKQGGLPSERVAVLPNFMSREPESGTGARGGVVYVGRLSSEKGLGVLLEAWKQLRVHIPLRIIGDGPLAAEVASAAADDQRIQWLGRVDDYDEVLDAIGAAGALVLPSIWYEACPKTVIEAFAKGTPVIASRLGALGEFVDHQRTGWQFEPGSATALAATVAQAFANPQAASTMRRAVREEYELRFTADQHYAGLLDIYEQALWQRRTIPCMKVAT